MSTSRLRKDGFYTPETMEDKHMGDESNDPALSAKQKKATQVRVDDR